MTRYPRSRFNPLVSFVGLTIFCYRSTNAFVISAPSSTTRTTTALSFMKEGSFHSYIQLCSGKEVDAGPNWIERSFPVTVNEKKAIDPKAIEDYNLGISGISFETGPLSKRMHEAIVSRSSLDTKDPEIARALKLYAMDFTAKEAVRAALQENGLEMVLSPDEEDSGMWGDVDSIRLLIDDDFDVVPSSTVYDSWEEAVDDWTPGQGFSFLVRQVPAKMRELTIEELMSALDSDGELRKEAEELKRRREEGRDAEPFA